MWIENRRRRKGENPKLTSKYVGPYTIVDDRPNHTYLINRDGQESWQNECQLKLYRPCEHPSGKAPYTAEPTRRPNMKGAVKKRPAKASSEPIPHRDQLLDELFPPAVVVPPPPTVTPSVEKDTRELSKRNNQPVTGQNTSPQEPTPCSTLDTGMKQETVPQEVVEVTPNLPIAVGRPRRATRKPDRYGHNICERIEIDMGHLQPGICLERQVNCLADVNII